MLYKNFKNYNIASLLSCPSELKYYRSCLRVFYKRPTKYDRDKGHGCNRPSGFGHFYRRVTLVVRGVILFAQRVILVLPPSHFDSPVSFFTQFKKK